MGNNNININVESDFIKDRSSPIIPIYLFSYNIEIFNRGELDIKLLSRYWHIKDGGGHIEEIRGPGVIGLKPTIKSSETFNYSSYCALKTPFGIMRGLFYMRDFEGNYFNILVSPFNLTAPNYIN